MMASIIPYHGTSEVSALFHFAHKRPKQYYYGWESKTRFVSELYGQSGCRSDRARRNDCSLRHLKFCSSGLDVPTGKVEMATVLIVEDEAQIRDFVAEELEESGYTVVVANNADQAISILEARQDITWFSPMSTCPVLWMG
jgi:hypothetical protein